MRILLTNYLRNGDSPADINSLDGGPIASARVVFDDTVGIEASDLTQDEIERYRPFVYEQLSEQAKESLFLKVHDAFTYTPYSLNPPRRGYSTWCATPWMWRCPLPTTRPDRWRPW
jgi:hypothetical protein